MTGEISISEIFGIFAFIGILTIILSFVGMFNSDLYGDLEQVKAHADDIKDSLEGDLKQAPFEPLKPYIFGVVAFCLTSICGIFGIPLVFKR